MIRPFVFALTVSVALGVTLGIVASPAVLAAGSQSPAPSASKPKDAEYEMAKRAVNAQNWSRAIALLTKVVSRDQNNADAHNFLGYSYRKSGDYDQALKYYEMALRIDPKHKGAHEYIGEAYLETGNLRMAEEHLEALDNLCFFSCQEYTDLKKAVQIYKKKHNIGS